MSSGLMFSDPQGMGKTSPQPVSAGIERGPSPGNVMRNIPDKGALSSGSLYEGVILDVNPSSGFATVGLNQGSTLSQCVFVSPIMGPLIGFTSSYYLPVGTSVLVCYKAGANSYITGAIPSEVQYRGMFSCAEYAPGFEGRSALAPYMDGEQPAGAGAPFPTDMLEGELDLGNAMGPVISFLMNVVKMSAGDRAKVEVCLLNSMVRMVSDYFVHHSAAGDEMIYNDGRLNRILAFTSYPHEADGKLTKEGPFTEVSEGVLDMTSISPDDTGRWRYNQFLGFVGDFVHEIISDPEEAIGKYAAGNLKSGKVQQYVGSDGTLLFRSVGEIALERVVRISHPVQIGKWDSPENPLKKEYEELDAKFLRVWEGWKDRESLAQTVWQLREYSRYLSCFFSYKRMLQLEKEGKMAVPLETAIPVPDWACKEKDKESAMQGGLTHYDVYACIRIMRDGSIVLLDGASSAVVLNQGNIQVSCPGNMDFSAGGTVSITGKNVCIKAANHVELAAISGSMKCSSRTGSQFYCELGSLWFRTDMSDSNESLAEGTQVFSDEEAPIPLRLGTGILFEAPEEGVRVLTQKNIDVKSTRGAFQLQVLEELNMQSARGAVTLKGLTGTIDTGQGLNIIASDIQSTATTFTVGSLLQISSGSALISPHIKSLGGIDAYGGVRSPIRELGRPKHKNHVDALEQNAKGPDPKEVKIAPTKAIEIEESDSVFTFEEIIQGTSPEDPSSPHIAASSDIIEYNPEMRKKMFRWDFSRNRLLYMPTAPYPGEAAQYVKYASTKSYPLDKPLGRTYGSLAESLGGAAEMTMQPPYIYARKPQ